MCLIHCEWNAALEIPGAFLGGEHNIEAKLFSLWIYKILFLTLFSLCTNPKLHIWKTCYISYSVAFSSRVDQSDSL